MAALSSSGMKRNQEEKSEFKETNSELKRAKGSDLGVLGAQSDCKNDPIGNKIIKIERTNFDSDLNSYSNCNQDAPLEILNAKPMTFIIPLNTERFQVAKRVNQKEEIDLKQLIGSTVLKWKLTKNLKTVPGDSPTLEILVNRRFDKSDPRVFYKSRIALRFLKPNGSVGLKLDDEIDEEVLFYEDDDKGGSWKIDHRFSKQDESLDIQLEIWTNDVVFKSDFLEMLNNATNTDVEISVQGETFKAHRLILMARSLMFFGVRASGGKIDIDDCHPSIFKVLLNFLYTGEISNAPDSDLKEMEDFFKQLLQLSEQYGIKALKHYCEISLDAEIEIANCVEILLLAEKNNANLLKNSVCSFINSNYNLLKENKDFIKFTQNKAHDLLFKTIFLSEREYKRLSLSDWLHWYSLSLDELKKDFSRLLDDETTADVEILTKNKKILKAHKLILGSRSSKMKKMLEKSSRIEIREFNERVMKQILHFIYTGSAERLEDRSMELFKFASKYDIKDLKDLTERNLMATLTIENVMDLFQLGDLHNANYLKILAIRFIKKNYSEVIETEKYMDLEVENSELTRQLIAYNTNF